MGNYMTINNTTISQRDKNSMKFFETSTNNFRCTTILKKGDKWSPCLNPPIRGEVSTTFTINQ